MNTGDNVQGIAVRKRILEFVVTYLSVHGYSPSVREIGDAVGLKSTSSVHSHLERMIRNGVLETDAPYGTPRAIRVPGYKFVREE